MSVDENRYFRFGQFCLDSRRRILYKNDQRIDISAKNFDLLCVLVQNDGRVMTHDELLDAVWSGTFVEQSNLKKGISALRQILDESPGESLYIRTVPRQGYAFVAPVTAAPDDPPAAPSVAPTSHTEVFIERTEEIIEDDSSRTLPPAASKTSRRYWPVAAILLLAAAASLISWRYVAGGSARRVGNVRVDKVSSDGDCLGRISPDANFVACVMSSESGDAAIEIRQIATESRRRLISLPKSNIYAIDFSPDGNFIYYVQKNHADDARSGIHKISVLGGEPKFLVRDVGSMAFAQDGRILLTRTDSQGTTNLSLADSEGRNERIVKSFPGNFRVWDFEFSPDQKSATLAIRRQVSDVKNVFYVIEVPLEGGGERLLVPERDTLIASATWMADAKSLLLCIREKNADIKQVWQFFVDSGEMTRLTNDNTSYRDVQVLRDGKTLSGIAENVYTNLFVGEAEDFDFRQLTSGAQELNGGFWLRDGRIAYASVENSSEVIRVVSEDGGSRNRVTEGKDGYWIQPSLGGDGQTIAFNSNRAGLDQLWKVGLDGRSLTQVTHSETPVFNGRLLSDGSAIYKTHVPGQNWVLMLQPPAGAAERLAAPGGGPWAVSPDERRIATVSDGPGAGECRLAIYDRTGPDVQTVDVSPACGIDRLIFDRDGNGVTFTATSLGTSEIYRVPLTGGKPKKISNFRRDRIYSIDWSFDGRKLAVVRGRGFIDPVFLRSAE